MGQYRVPRFARWRLHFGTNNNSHEQKARAIALQAAYRKAEVGHPRDDAPAAGEIKSLGLLDARKEENGVKPAKPFPSYKQ